MLFKRIESKGLAHYSYIIGEGHEAVVIDPRRDCDVYVEEAEKQGMRITHILETHRNEDYAIGSLELEALSGAEIWHADDQWEYQYGKPVQDDQTWNLGGLKIKAIHSPGHTPGLMSYLLQGKDGAPWMLFAGDTLFAGDVGRVDLMGPDRLDEMAGLLYDTLFHRLLPLGDEVILCPAHGAGSVCGSVISDRPWTTIGIERRTNSKLKFTERSEFISNTAKILEQPPYFKQMERLNVQGPPIMGRLPIPVMLSPEEFSDAVEGSIVLDTRSELEFGAAHIPNALSIWLDGVASFAGWFLTYDRPVLLVSQDANEAVRYLIRLGYDDLPGQVAGGMLAWHKAGKDSASHKMMTTQDVCKRLDRREDLWILDVRSERELHEEGKIPGAHHIHITQLPYRFEEIPRARPIYVFCGTGLRSTIAASLLQIEGWEDVTVVLGGFEGWNSMKCPIEK